MDEEKTDLQNYSGIAPPAYIPPTTETAPPTGSPKADLSVSSIEKSMEMAMESVPGMSAPILVAPTTEFKTESSGSLVALISGIEIGEVKIDIWKKYQENLQHMQEQIATLIASPTYQALLFIKIHGNTADGIGVQSASSINTANPIDNRNFTITSSVNQLQKTLSKAAPEEEKTSDPDAAQMIIPMTTAVFIGGAMALAGMEISTSPAGISSNPVQGSMEIIDKLQQSLPALNIQDTILTINLMVMAPIYYNAFNEAASRLPNKEQANHTAASQKFAQDILKMVKNPNLITAQFVNKMEGADQMSPARKQEISTVIKLILSTVAISLLYSTETGKVQGGQFWGTTEEEMRNILLGNSLAPDPAKATTTQEELSSALLVQVQAQLAALSPAQKLNTVEAILSFVSSKHSIKTMLDPNEVLQRVLSSMNFDAEEAKTVDKQPA